MAPAHLLASFRAEQDIQLADDAPAPGKHKSAAAAASDDDDDLFADDGGYDSAGSPAGSRVIRLLLATS